MGPLDWLAVGLGTLAFFLVGAVWYGLLFGRIWARETGVTEPPSGPAMARIMGLTLLCEFIVVAMLAHLIARTQPPPHVRLMMAEGFAGAIMIPAVGINYLHQRKSLTLFLIDAGHYLVGMAVVGAIFVWRA